MHRTSRYTGMMETPDTFTILRWNSLVLFLLNIRLLYPYLYEPFLSVQPQFYVISDFRRLKKKFQNQWFPIIQFYSVVVTVTIDVLVLPLEH